MNENNAITTLTKSGRPAICYPTAAEAIAAPPEGGGCFLHYLADGEILDPTGGEPAPVFIEIEHWVDPDSLGIPDAAVAGRVAEAFAYHLSQRWEEEIETLINENPRYKNAEYTIDANVVGTRCGGNIFPESLPEGSITTPQEAWDNWPRPLMLPAHYEFGPAPHLVPLSEQVGYRQDLASFLGLEDDENSTFAVLTTAFDGHPAGTLVLTGLSVEGHSFWVFPGETE